MGTDLATLDVPADTASAGTIEERLARIEAQLARVEQLVVTLGRDARALADAATSTLGKLSAGPGGLLSAFFGKG